jgi:hypothetical protein
MRLLILAGEDGRKAVAPRLDAPNATVEASLASLARANLNAVVEAYRLA